MHQPGIEPGSPRWQRDILPLDHWCNLFKKKTILIKSIYDRFRNFIYLLIQLNIKFNFFKKSHYNLIIIKIIA